MSDDKTTDLPDLECVHWQEDEPVQTLRRFDCGLSCNGRWQRVRGAEDRPGWMWSCSRMGCQYTAVGHV